MIQWVLATIFNGFFVWILNIQFLVRPSYRILGLNISTIDDNQTKRYFFYSQRIGSIVETLPVFVILVKYQLTFDDIRLPVFISSFVIFMYLFLIVVSDLIKIFKRNYSIYGLNKIADFIFSWILVSPLLTLVFGADLWLAIYSLNLSQF